MPKWVVASILIVVPSYRVELHSHCQGDPIDTHLNHTVFQHIDQAKAVGLDAIAVTWHRRICDNAEATAYGRERDVLLISGMETEINRAHVVVLNLAEGDLEGETTWDKLRALRTRKPEVFVIAPHPFYLHPSCLGGQLNDNVDCIDAVEWCMLHLKWVPERMNPNLRAARWAHKYSKPLIATSDAHGIGAIGRNASAVEADALTPEALFAGIKAGRVSFPRHPMAFKQILNEATKVIFSQHRYVARLVKSELAARRRA